MFERLDGAGRVVEVSAPAGSGKTSLLRSWISDRGLSDRVAWVTVQAEEQDGQRFWLSVLDALRDTRAGSARVRELTAAPGLDTDEILERLLEDLDSEDSVWVIIDDLHELRSRETLGQLEKLVMRAPVGVRFALATRRDLRLGLHRVRLEGGLTEIRARDLLFTPAEARELFGAAGVELSESALARLHELTEGWVTGLRLAAVSLAGCPEPERLATQFHGGERTVAEYLLAEVLDRQPHDVRQLLLRISILDRVTGPLADHLTGASGGERILRELEQANAFVVSLDASRSWFRCHHLFADLLTLELRRSRPGEVRTLHRAAAEWFAQHEHPVEAIRHAQAAEDWSLAAGFLMDHWFSLVLDGRAATGRELLCGFPEHVACDTPELIALAAADELDRGSFEEAERHLGRATSQLVSLPPERRRRLQVVLGILRLCLARQRGDLPTVAVQAQQLLAPVDAAPVSKLEMRGEWRVLALISLGIAETYAGRSDRAERHLEQGIAMARRLARPYLELLGLAHGAQIVAPSYAEGIRRSRQAIELARHHGWSEEPLAGVAYASLAGALVAKGQWDEAERCLASAGRTLRAEIEPGAGVTLHWTRGLLALGRGRLEQAREDFETAERLAGLLHGPLAEAGPMRAHALQTLARLGQGDRVQAALDEMDADQRDTVWMRSAIAALRLHADDPEAATVALAPVIAGSLPACHPLWLIEALLLEAVARDMLGDAGATDRAIERALDLAEPDGILFPFLAHPIRGLLERHHRRHATHAPLVAELLNVLAGRPPSAPVGEAQRLREPLSESETRVLRYLPTNLSLREIGNELYVSVHTIKTHIRNLYGKLDVHSRGEAVEQARVLGLLAPAARVR